MCGWATLSQRRQQHKQSFMYNINSGMASFYTQGLIPPLASEISDFPLRNNYRDISVPLNRTSIHRNLVFHQPLGYGIFLMIP